MSDEVFIKTWTGHSKCYCDEGDAEPCAVCQYERYLAGVREDAEGERDKWRRRYYKALEKVKWIYDRLTKERDDARNGSYLACQSYFDLQQSNLDLRAKLAEANALLRDVQDHGLRTLTPLGPEATDLLARIDAALREAACE